MGKKEEVERQRAALANELGKETLAAAGGGLVQKRNAQRDADPMKAREVEHVRRQRVALLSVALG